MKIIILADDGKRVASIDDMSKDAWDAFTLSASKLLADQTDDRELAAVMLMTSFMANVGGRAADSIFLTGIPEQLMKTFDELTSSVGLGKASQFLARLIQMSGHDALHIINNNLEGGRFGHSILFTGIPPETMKGWAQLSEIAQLPEGELLARIMVGGISFSEQDIPLFKERMAQERKMQQERIKRRNEQEEVKKGKRN